MIFLIRHEYAVRLVNVLDHLYQVSACSKTFMRWYANLFQRVCYFNNLKWSAVIDHYVLKYILYIITCSIIIICTYNNMILSLFLYRKIVCFFLLINKYTLICIYKAYIKHTSVWIMHVINRYWYLIHFKNNRPIFFWISIVVYHWK